MEFFFYSSSDVFRLTLFLFFSLERELPPFRAGGRGFFLLLSFSDGVRRRLWKQAGERVESDAETEQEEREERKAFQKHHRRWPLSNSTSPFSQPQQPSLFKNTPSLSFSTDGVGHGLPPAAPTAAAIVIRRWKIRRWKLWRRRRRRRRRPRQQQRLPLRASCKQQQHFRFHLFFVVVSPGQRLALRRPPRLHHGKAPLAPLLLRPRTE